MTNFDFVRIGDPQSTGDTCPLCGESYHQRPSHGHGICVGRYEFTPNALTAEEIRKIVREELQRALEAQRRSRT